MNFTNQILFTVKVVDGKVLGSKNIILNKEYAVIGTDKLEQKFNIAGENGEFIYVEIHACRFCRILTGESINNLISEQNYVKSLIDKMQGIAVEKSINIEKAILAFEKQENLPPYVKAGLGSIKKYLNKDKDNENKEDM